MNLVHTPDQILRKVCMALGVSMIVIVALFILAGDGATGIGSEILAAEA